LIVMGRKVSFGVVSELLPLAISTLLSNSSASVSDCRYIEVP
jgi:hypothetical protein